MVFSKILEKKRITQKKAYLRSMNKLSSLLSVSKKSTEIPKISIGFLKRVAFRREPKLQFIRAYGLCE